VGLAEALTQGAPYLASGAAAVLACTAPAALESVSNATPAAQAAAALESVVGETVASPKQTRYRNKATFFFAASDDGGGLVVGSKAADDPGRVVPLGAEGCPLQAWTHPATALPVRYPLPAAAGGATLLTRLALPTIRVSHSLYSLYLLC